MPVAPQLTTAKHTCGGPAFGRKTPGCPRCDDLLAGAQPVTWAATRRRQDEEAHRQALWAHDCTASRCGPVCTFGDW